MRILEEDNSPKRKSRIAFVEHKSGLLKTQVCQISGKKLWPCREAWYFYVLPADYQSLSLA
jgi:hypothetical protein